MNIPVKLNKLEEIFGPALPGASTPECTLSAVKYASAKKGVYGGIQGIKPDAFFYVHFPLPIDWERLATKKGAPDYVNDLKESGPQGAQGRKELVEQFLSGLQEKKAQEQRVRLEEENRASTLKRFEQLVGTHTVTVSVNGETLTLPYTKIALDKKRKLTLTALV